MRRWGARAAVLFGASCLTGCPDRPVAPSPPDALFQLAWSILGERQEIFLEKDDAISRVDGECPGDAIRLCPSGFDGEILEVFLGDPYVGLPAPVGTAWYDSFFVSLGDTFVVEEITWRIARDDTLISTEAGDFSRCMEIVRTSNLEPGTAHFFFAPEVGLVRVDRRDDRFLVDADLQTLGPVGNAARDGRPFSPDHMPLAVGNAWTYEGRGRTDSFVQTYRIE